MFELVIAAEAGPDGGFTLDALGVPVTYDAASKTIAVGKTTAPLAPGAYGQVLLQVLVDVGSIEVYGNDGRVAISEALLPVPGARPLAIAEKPGGTKVRMIQTYELKSAWREDRD